MNERIGTQRRFDRFGPAGEVSRAERTAGSGRLQSPPPHVELLPELKKEAKERQVRKPKSAQGQIPEQDKGQSRDEAAAMVGVKEAGRER